MKKVKAVAMLFLLVLIFLLTSQSCKKDEGPTEPAQENTSVTIGTLSVNPSAIFINTYSTLTVRLTVPAGTQLADSIVSLVKVDASGNELSSIGSLYDDGQLSHGDEIIGDNIYSGILYITESSAGTLTLMAKAQVKQTSSNVDGKSEKKSIDVYTKLTSEEMNTVINTQSSASTQLSQYIAGNVNNVESAVTQLTSWLQQNSNIQSATMSGSTSIDITYKNGLSGGIVVSVEEASGGVTRGGYIKDPGDERKNKKAIPLKKQTVGTTIPPRNIVKRMSKVYGDPDPKLIGNRNVLIYAPYEAAFSPHNESSSVISILQKSGFEFEIHHYSNQDANVAVLYSLTDYGFVLLATHGSGGKSFLTGEVVDTTTVSYQDSYKALLKAKKLKISTNVTIAQNGEVKTKKDVYGINASFLGDIGGTFPNSVILNNSCESTKSDELQNAFINKGAKTYYGYDKVVGSGFCVTNADTVVKRLAKDLKTTGEAFMAGSDPGSNHANFQMKGENDIRFPDDLINGDFEYGKLTGWTKSGDGRVISKLGGQSPTGGSYMGIISTGLGYTDATGKIYQTFTIRQTQSTLTVKWNFLSEEFLEYINSSFQDYFTVIIKDDAGVESSLIYKSIDGIASDFGASKTYDENGNVILEPGNLIKVSPGIVFDVGDVYMTGWQTSTFDVSAYKGKRITLSIAAGDVGDSIYDTAILIDDVSIK